jgi:glycosyltransferase involved in cell wall biosynthesis
MTRVLLTADTVGGVWTYTVDLARSLGGAGIDPIVVTLGPPASAGQRAALAGLPCLDSGLPLDWLAADAGGVRRAGAGLARIARELGVDLVQLHAPALAAGAGFDRPVVAVVHSCVATWWRAVRSGPLPPDLAWRAALTADGLAAADLVVAPSASFAAALRQTYSLSTPPMVVPNGRSAGAAAANVGPCAAGLTVGRLWDAGKNVAVLDRAAAMARVPIRAAGPVTGPDGTGIALHHLEPLGPLPSSAVRAALAARPVFLSAALYEPFGLAVLEAAQAGCALVLADIPTFRELWEGAARFVYPHDAAGFARALDEIVANPELRHRLGAAARARADAFGAADAGAAMARHYRSLLAADAPVLEAAE